MNEYNLMIYESQESVWDGPYSLEQTLRSFVVVIFLFQYVLSPILTDMWLQVMAILLLNPDQLFVPYQLHVLNRKLGHLMQWLN